MGLLAFVLAHFNDGWAPFHLVMLSRPRSKRGATSEARYTAW